jgi:hypothetical protein
LQAEGKEESGSKELCTQAANNIKRKENEQTI